MKLAEILGKAAPWLAAAAAGPAGLAGMALRTIGEAVGAKSVTPDSLVTAVAEATPEQLTALRQADQDFEVRMRELGFREATELEAIAAGDRKSARDMQIATRSLVPATITFLVLAAFNTALFALFKVAVPEGNRDIVVYMIGQLSGFAAAAVAYWLGTTRNSQNKTDLLAKAKPIE
jgi:hypothetical protein